MSGRRLTAVAPDLLVTAAGADEEVSRTHTHDRRLHRHPRSTVAANDFRDAPRTLITHQDSSPWEDVIVRPQACGSLEPQPVDLAAFRPQSVHSSWERGPQRGG